MNNHALEVSRVINAPIERVWQAWTDPEIMKEWYAPEGLTTPEAEVDLRVGGSYRIAMKGPDGTHVAVGHFTVVDAPRTVSFSWKWEGSNEPETTVTLTFDELEPTKTKVTLRHEGFTDEKGVEMHAKGWTSMWSKLEKQVAT